MVLREEEKFHLQQATLRSKIRIQDGRAKPIDLLAQYISTEDEDLDIQMHEPYTILVGLTQGDLSDLVEDIKVYMELEQGKNTEYWQDITSVCKDELQKLKKKLRDDQVARRDGIHSAVHSDVAAIFRGKTYTQLIALEKQIYSKITSGDAVDIGYWESLLQQLQVFMAKARLKERHQKMLREKLVQLKQQASIPELWDSCGHRKPILLHLYAQLAALHFLPETTSNNYYYEPSVLFSQDKALPSSAMEADEARRGMGPDEETFNVAVPLSQKTYVWEDKYRPRKPRFFNRVHTGYEWNKYNQTHYDSDTPPPKIVQGYKFNIFYPDLIDKTVAPEYFLDPTADSHEFAILRFHAGPPYEDIAFKIVNREWEYSHRKGFRCQFHNNIFQLWFHFKRYRYRR
ncbi:hypothetical protein QZH41_015937 [Actinostola sp. cb2023]|nr:hypothetical protein QZH41_015937 [Actinostola sp. cb2023]